MKVAIHTLGCKNNQLESSSILDEFISNGWEAVNFNDIADIYIINTCTVTAKSDSHSRSFIRKAIKTNPNAKVIVTGCYAQISSDDISKIEGVSLIVGNTNKNEIYKLANSLTEEKIIVKDILKLKEFDKKDVFSASGRTRINVKIQDGCNYRCSYCIVPFARGPSRSNKIDNVIKQITNVSKTYPEVVLTAIHLGQYGLDLEPKLNLAHLLQELEKIETLQRVRLSSIDPLELNDELIDVLANSKKVCRHLHISLQSADNNILKSMNRRYTVEQYTEIMEKLTSKIDGLAIGSDIIVGFPGEEDSNFETTYNNLKSLPLCYFHVFSYSKRKGTKAAEFPDQVDPQVKKERNKRLKDLSSEKNYLFRKTFEGKILNIIPEFQRDKKKDMLKGISDNYITVHVSADDSYMGKITPVKITSVTKLKTTGTIN